MSIQNTGNLANIYRPKTFAEVVGQDLVVAALKRIAMAEGITVRSIFLHGSWGSGKCILGNQRIETAYGYQKIGDLGSKKSTGFSEFRYPVNTPFGYQYTSHFYKEHNAVVRKITTKSGRVFSGTLEHPIYSYIVGTPYPTLHKTSELSVGDYICTTIRVPNIEVTNKSEFKQFALYGALLGDGGVIKSNNTLSVYYTGVDGFCKWCKSVEGVDNAISVDKRTGVELYRIPLQKSVLYGILDDKVTNAYTKSMSEFSFVTRERALATLIGLLITDGSVDSQGRVEISTTSKTLADNILDICDYLSMRVRFSVKKTSYTYKGEKREGKLAYRITWYAEGMQILGILLSKVQKYLDLPEGRITRIYDNIVSHLAVTSESRSNNQRNIVRLGDSTQDFVDNLRKCRKNTHRGDFITRAASNAKQFKCTTSLTINKCLDRAYKSGAVVPDYMKYWGGVYFEEIVAIEEVKDTVYDVTIPSGHLFYSMNCVNHNTTTARLFGRALNCERFKETGDVCNECAHCKDAMTKTSQLYKEFDATSVGNIESIRLLGEQLAIAPNGRRLVVIDEVHACSNQALNALLKIVEDGVPNTIFCFCSTEDILPTIKSRSLCLDVGTIPANIMIDRIREIAISRNTQISDENLSILAMKSQGHMRDALQLLQLYELAGERGLDSSYLKLKKFIINSFSKNPAQDPTLLLEDILRYPTVDIKLSIGTFIRNIFTAKPDTVEFKMLQAGLGKQLFSYFFSPTAQQALRSEVGVEILLRAFLDRAQSKSRQ